MTFSQKQVEQRLRSLFASSPDVVFAYLFGSLARGKGGPLSDVDIAVFLDPLPDDSLNRQLLLADQVARALGVSEVDLVVLNTAPLPLAYRVLRDGVLLFCRDRDRQVAYQARVVSMYLDFAPNLALYERRFLECAAKGVFRRGHDPYREALTAHQRRHTGSEPPRPG